MVLYCKHFVDDKMNTYLYLIERLAAKWSIPRSPLSLFFIWVCIWLNLKCLKLVLFDYIVEKIIEIYVSINTRKNKKRTSLTPSIKLDKQ